MSDHLAFIDEYANKFKVEQQQKSREPIMKETVNRAVETYDDNDEDDEFLTDNGWTLRRGLWTDSVTMDRLPYDTAYAVQKERYRMEDIVEDLQTKIQKKQQFFDGKIREAADIIKNQSEKIDECEEYINRLDETVSKLKEKPKAKRTPSVVMERAVEPSDAPKKRIAPKATVPTPKKPLTTMDRAAEILGDFGDDDNPLYDTTQQEALIAHATNKFVEPEPMVMESSMPMVDVNMSPEDMEAMKLEMEAMRSIGSAGGISESAMTSDIGGFGGAPAKYTVSPPNKAMQEEAGSYLF